MEWAEKVARTNKEAMRLVDKGEYEDAANMLNEALRLASHQLGEDDEDYGAETARRRKRSSQLPTTSTLAMTAPLQSGASGATTTTSTGSRSSSRSSSSSGSVGTSSSPLAKRLTATCLNNLGCLHTRRGRPRTALACLERAARIESSLPPGAADNPAGTHLNICAALSGIGAHARAVRHAAHAVEILTRQYGTGPQGSTMSNVDEGASSRSDRGLLAKAYHNLAVESEHLGHDTDALLAYKRATQAAARAWGPGSGSEVMRSQLRGFLQKARPMSAAATTHSRDSSAQTRIYTPGHTRPRSASRPSSRYL